MLLAAPPQQDPKPIRPPAAEAPAPKPFGTLRVHVENVKGAPIAEASVEIEKLNRVHETGETGDVLLAWIPVGKHGVKVTKTGFKMATATATIEEDKITVLTLRLEAAPK
jgi:hypothetical protein